MSDREPPKLCGHCMKAHWSTTEACCGPCAASGHVRDEKFTVPCEACRSQQTLAKHSFTIDNPPTLPEGWTSVEFRCDPAQQLLNDVFKGKGHFKMTVAMIEQEAKARKLHIDTYVDPRTLEMTIVVFGPAADMQAASTALATPPPLALPSGHA